MNNTVLLFGALALLGTAVFVVTQKEDPALMAEQERRRQLEQQLMLAQFNSQQYAQQAAAPALAMPTQQGQTAGGAVASLFDGLYGIYTLLS
jgi:hypothetical protein